MTAAFRRSPDVVESRLGEEAVLLHVAAGQYYGVDAVGTFLWSLLDEARTADDLCAALHAEFDVGEAAVDADVAAFLETMQRRGLVVAAR